MLFNYRYRIILLLWGFIFSGTVVAELYKWVDADGNTHYTQSPPPDGIAVDTIKPPPKVNTESAKKEQEVRQKKLDAIIKSRAKQKEANLKEREKVTLYEDNCKKAMAKLKKEEKTAMMMKKKGSAMMMKAKKSMATMKKKSAMMMKKMAAAAKMMKKK